MALKSLKVINGTMSGAQASNTLYQNDTQYGRVLNAIATETNPPTAVVFAGTGIWTASVGSPVAVNSSGGNASYKYAALINVTPGQLLVLHGFNALNNLGTGLVAFVDGAGNYLSRMQGNTSTNVDLTTGHFEMIIPSSVAKIGIYFNTTDLTNFPLEGVSYAINPVIAIKASALPVAGEAVAGITPVTDTPANTFNAASARSVWNLQNSIFPYSPINSLAPYSSGYWDGVVGSAPTIHSSSAYVHHNTLTPAVLNDVVVLINWSNISGSTSAFIMVDAAGNYLGRMNFNQARTSNTVTGYYEFLISNAACVNVGIHFNTTQAFLPANAVAYIFPQGHDPRLINSSKLDMVAIKAAVGPAVSTHYLNSQTSMYSRGAATKTYGADTRKKAILVMGQSNTDGRVPAANFPLSYVDELGATVAYLNGANKIDNSMYNKNNYTAPAFSNYTLPSLWAYDAIVLARLTHKYADTVYMMTHAVGGTAIDTTGTYGGGFWTPRFENIDAYNVANGVTAHKLLAEAEQTVRVAASLNPNVYDIKAILWHQGEGDSTVAAKVKYYDNFIDVIDYIRGALGKPTLPFIFGTISHVSAQYTPEVEAAQLSVATQATNVYYVDMSAGTLLDSYHFDAASTEYLGTQMYQILRDKVL